MDFVRLSGLVDASIVLDVNHASMDELKVFYDPSDETNFFLIAPKKFGREEDLAAIINAKASIKLQAKKASEFK
ncbi:MAG TPA: hypothetical protein VHE53_00160 [Patescibacteria group bacterium]|nr:hypothetical protein [Patescibacteria group bacterium]